MLPARANPFRAECIETLRFRLDDAGWRQLLERFAANRWRGLLLGPHGSGKTTLREEIERRLRSDGWTVRALVIDERGVSWSTVSKFIDGAGPRTLISIDGLDRLGGWQWWRLTQRMRHGGGILATSHVPGRLPLLHRHHTSIDLVHDLVRELVGEDTAHAVRERCQRLFTELHGDVRACLRRLYDDAAAGTIPLETPVINDGNA